MQLQQLEHILRASGAITNERVFIVIGSQAILASLPQPPAELTVSREADLYSPDAPHKADLITGSIGEFSMFDETFGYYADGVSPNTAILPPSWRDRLVTLANDNTAGVVGLCLSPIDIAISKLAAGRKKDFDYVRALIRHNIINAETLRGLLDELSPEQRLLIEPRLAGLT